MRSVHLASLFGMLLMVRATTLYCQEPPSSTDMTVDASTRSAVIDHLLQEIHDFYIDPNVAATMAQEIRHRQENLEYESITSARQLAEVLTRDLRRASHDRHLALHYSESLVRPIPFPPPPPPPELLNRQRQAFSRTNFGFAKVEILTGDIGYLDLRGFMPPTWIGDTLAATMGFLANTQALIVDLRQNGGGGPDSVVLTASYFFDEPVRMNDIYTRPSNETRQFWTLPYVPGRRFTQKDVYILTSNRTFSAAEDFTYAMKNLKRATIVGEPTGGGAHPVGTRRIADHFVVAVPMGRSISPITHEDWEGVGVEPDVKVPSPEALDKAYLIALEKVQSSSSDDSTRSEISAEIERLKSKLASSAH